MSLALDVLVFLIGALLVLYTFDSAARTFILPRAQNVLLTRSVFRTLGFFFTLIGRLVRDPDREEAIWAMYAPFGLLLLPFVWLILLLAGFMGMFWTAGVRSWPDAFLLSGSSLLTLGFAPVDGLFQTVLSFLDAAFGLVMIALLIAYLPTMYAAFSRREALVAKLEVYAGAPPSPIEIIARMHRIGGISSLRELFQLWETWFAEIEEAHTSLAPLNFFRSPKPHRSWVTAAGAVLDAASLALAALDAPFEPRAALCIRSGYIALRHIGEFFGISYRENPSADDEISITREEFEAALTSLEDQGVRLKPDRERAWEDYKGWRVNYDDVLVGLAFLTLAPSGMWSSDRISSESHGPTPFVRRWPNRKSRD